MTRGERRPLALEKNKSKVGSLSGSFFLYCLVNCYAYVICMYCTGLGYVVLKISYTHVQLSLGGAQRVGGCCCGTAAGACCS